VESMDGTHAELPEPGIVLAQTPSAGRVSSSASGVSISRVSWHGWSDCVLIQNGMVEAVVVPAIGRVIHFGLAGQKSGCFWQNRALDGQLHQKVSTVCLVSAARPRLAAPGRIRFATHAGGCRQWFDQNDLASGSSAWYSACTPY